MIKSSKEYNKVKDSFSEIREKLAEKKIIEKHLQDQKLMV